MSNQEMISTVLKASLEELYDHASALQNDNPEIRKAVQHASYNPCTNIYNKEINVHIKCFIDKSYIQEKKTANIIVTLHDYNEYHIFPTWVTEEQERKDILRQALLDYYSEDDKPYQER